MFNKDKNHNNVYVYPSRYWLYGGKIVQEEDGMLWFNFTRDAMANGLNPGVSVICLAWSSG